MSSPDRLVYMANQIGTFFRSQGHDKAVPGIADHIKKFWDPRMKRAIFAHLDAGGAGLEPNVLEALTSLKQAGARTHQLRSQFGSMRAWRTPDS